MAPREKRQQPAKTDGGKRQSALPPCPDGYPRDRASRSNGASSGGRDGASAATATRTPVTGPTARQTHDLNVAAVDHAQIGAQIASQGAPNAGSARGRARALAVSAATPPATNPDPPGPALHPNRDARPDGVRHAGRQPEQPQGRSQTPSPSPRREKPPQAVKKPPPPRPRSPATAAAAAATVAQKQ